MATYAKGTETKRQLIDLTWKMLCDRDAASVSVRDIARSKGCSAAAIYRHFESLEYLIAVASVRFLDEYMLQYARLMEEDLPLLENYVRGWELFDQYAFARPDVYYRLFWGQDSVLFSRTLREYLELFPVDGSERYLSTFYRLMLTPDMYERDMLTLRQPVQMRLLTEEDAQYFARTNPLIVRGLLAEAMTQPPERRAESERLCSALIRKNMEKVMS